MKQKILITSILFILVALVLLGTFFWQEKKPNKIESVSDFTDQTNKVSLEHPESWTASSIEGFVTLMGDPQKTDSPKIIVTINTAEFFVEARGLTEKAEQIKIGNKNLRVNHKKTEDGQTFTHLYWKDENAKIYLFEISPWQKDAWSEEIKKAIETFRPL